MRAIRRAFPPGGGGGRVGGGGGGGPTAGSSRRRSQLKSVCRTFRFLLQQRRSVSPSARLNEGLVSRHRLQIHWTRSVCLLSIRPCVYSRLHPALPPLQTPSPPTQTVTFTGASLPHHPLFPHHPLLPPSPSPPSVHKTGLDTLHFTDAR